jgi:hypothetical protein
MAKIEVRTPEEAVWRRGADLSTPEMAATLAEGEAESLVNMLFPGGEDAPQLFEVKQPPNMPILLHAHDEDEIIYIVGGSMRLGTRTLGPGSGLSIRGGAFYSFQAGPEGLHFLNFRPRKDNSYRAAPGRRDPATREARP